MEDPNTETPDMGETDRNRYSVGSNTHTLTFSILHLLSNVCGGQIMCVCHQEDDLQGNITFNVEKNACVFRVVSRANVSTH